MHWKHSLGVMSRNYFLAIVPVLCYKQTPPQTAKGSEGEMRLTPDFDMGAMPLLISKVSALSQSCEAVRLLLSRGGEYG